MALADGGIGQRTGEEALAAPGRAGDEHVVVLSHPCPLGQRQYHRAVEAPGRAEVDVLDGRRVTQFGCFQPGGEAPAVAGVGLFVDQQAQPVGEGQASS